MHIKQINIAASSDVLITSPFGSLQASIEVTGGENPFVSDFATASSDRSSSELVLRSFMQRRVEKLLRGKPRGIKPAEIKDASY